MSASSSHAPGPAGGQNSLGLPGRPEDCRVVVAMSGGVDSSVVAALLRREGYDVVGITLQLYDQGASSGRKGACCAGQDIHDARNVAAALGIPHYVLDYEERFARDVIGAFADSYRAGETPVPCIACNQRVKFRDLLATAKQLSAQAMATGHYVASRPGVAGYDLYRAADVDRDQSYFLFATARKELDFLRFPLGNMPKAEVRRLAREFALPVADKADSQDICFVPSGRYADVIERLHPGAGECGDIVHVDGRVLGRHDGIIHYTIGQRRGLGLATGEPLFVVRLDAMRRQVVVGAREHLRTGAVLLRDCNWLGDSNLDEEAAGGLEIFARVRSSQPPRRATLFAPRGGALGGAARVQFCAGSDGEEPFGIAPGQACVFYANAAPQSRVLGGGWIERTLGVREAEAAEASASAHEGSSRRRYGEEPGARISCGPTAGASGPA